MFERFQFRKFIPTQDVIIYANTKLFEIMNLAPAEATCRATLVKVGNNYHSSIHIDSPTGDFFANAKAIVPQLSIDLLEEDIRRQLGHSRRGGGPGNLNSNCHLPTELGREQKYA